MYYIYILSGKDRKDRFENNCQTLRLIHTYPATESGRSESGPFVIENYVFVIVFIRGAPVEDDTPSECIRTVAVTYGCKIL